MTVGKSWTEKARRVSSGGCTDPASTKQIGFQGQQVSRDNRTDRFPGATEQIGFQGQLEEWTAVKVLTGQAVSDH